MKKKIFVVSGVGMCASGNSYSYPKGEKHAFLFFLQANSEDDVIQSLKSYEAINEEFDEIYPSDIGVLSNFDIDYDKILTKAYVEVMKSGFSMVVYSKPVSDGDL